MKSQISSVKGSLLPQFSCYTLAKLIRFFQTFRIGFFDFEIAALDVMKFEWPYIFPRSRINLPLVIFFVFLGDKGETKSIREATFETSYLRLTARNTNFENWVGTALVSS